MQRAIEDATGEAVKWFRPPFGARRPDVLRTAVELGLTPVHVEHHRARLGCDGLRDAWRRGCKLGFTATSAGTGAATYCCTTAVTDGWEPTAPSPYGDLDSSRSWAGSGLRNVTVDAWAISSDGDFSASSAVEGSNS